MMKEDRDKQNYRNIDVLKTFEKHQKIIGQLNKQMSNKISKKDFYLGMGSKLSLSDVGSLCQDQSNLTGINKQYQIKIEQLKVQMRQMREQMNNNKILMNQRQAKFKQLQRMMLQKQEKSKKCVKQTNQIISKVYSQKADRSQIDKVIQLSNLLSIQFELIKKRFNGFQIDYNATWKEISNIYQNIQSIKTDVMINGSRYETLQTRMESYELQCKKQENNKYNCYDNELKIQQICKKQIKMSQQANNNILKMIQNLKQQVQCQKQRVNSTFQQIQNIKMGFDYRQNKKEMADQIQKTKQLIYLKQKQYTHKLQAKFKQQQQLVYSEVNSNNYSFKSQIKQACLQLTYKIQNIFKQCARQQEYQLIKASLQTVQNMQNQKISSLNTILKRHQQSNKLKLQSIQRNILNLHKQLQIRIKPQQVDKMLSKYTPIQQNKKHIKQIQNKFHTQITQLNTQQKAFSHLMRSQMIVGRWLWEGVLKNNLVLWQRQAVNTLPQNFIFSKHQSHITIINPGIYKIQMSFFSKKRPSIQLVINGQSIVSAVNSSSYVLHHSSGKLKDIKNSQITGLTYSDFLSLSHNSRLSVSYMGQIGHGFMSLQRL